MTRSPITDRQMLAAAERRLAEHLRLRPSTPADRDAIVAAEKASADRLIAAAAALRGCDSLTAADRVAAVGRGPQCIDLQHEEGRQSTFRLREAMGLESAAAKHLARAEAWQQATDATYGAVESELRARADYYRGLVARREEASHG